jgi:TonB-dependent starch-binding outer membrane protein SusC
MMNSRDQEKTQRRMSNQTIMRKKLPFYNGISNRRSGWVVLLLMMLQIPQSIFSQSSTAVSGKIISQEDGKPIPGVSIVIKDTSIGTVTDVDGNYSLNASENAILVFSFVGFITEEVPVNSQSVINVTMKMQIQSLDEIVVTGYSTQRKKDITGSVAVLDMDNLQKVLSRSAEDALQGMAAGVSVIRSGGPGRGSKILIRGVTNFGNTDPLVIVDGIEQDLNNISAKDIESIQVLKDAGAAAIYGVRGANGVIIVTTKKGKVGAPVVSYDAYYGMQYPLPGNPYNILDSKDYMEVYNRGIPGNEKFQNGMPDYMYRGPDGAGVAFEGDPEVDPSKYFLEVPNKGKNYIIQKVNKEGTDWFHELFKKAPITEHNLNVSGGTEKSKYLFALGYFNQQGTMVNSFMKRYSGRVNTEFKIGERIRIGENVNIIYRDAGATGGVAAYNQQPIVPLRDIMGNWGGTYGGTDLGDGTNLVALQYRTDKDLRYTWNTIGNVFAEVDFLKNVKARTSIGYNISNSYNQDFSTTQYENIQQSSGDNTLNVNSSFGSTMTFTNTLKYDNSFGKSDLSVLVGSEAIRYHGRGVSGSSRKLFSEEFNYLILNNGPEQITNGSSISERALFSLFSRLDYGYDSRYLVGITLRRDGSSKFGPDRRYGIFPSFSVAWRLIEERFMENISWLDDLKLRASYGVLGSENNVSNINAYSFFGSDMTGSYYDITGSSHSIVQGFSASRIGNTKTGWEENVVTNVGFDIAALNNTIDFSMEYYKKKINGLLFTEPLPVVVTGGADAPSVNIGDIQNTGIDASLAYHKQISNDFNFSVRGNITHFKNEIVDIPDPGYFFSGSHQGVGAMVRNEEGQPISSFFGYNILGLFNSDAEVDDAPTQDGAAPGRFRYQDTDGDGDITPEDRTHLGSPHPDFTYGLNLSLNFKGFDLSAFFYGSQGNEIYNLTRANLYFLSYYPTTNKSNELLNAWTPENTDTNIPKLESTQSFSNNKASNSFYIEDGSFLKFKSLVLGYTVNPEILAKINISKLRIYAQAANLFTVTKYTGLDPEVVGRSTSVMGLDDGGYPNNEASLILGVSATF